MKGGRIDREIGQLLHDAPLRTNSLIITLFGDAIAPHGGTVWLGSLIRLAAPLGINSRAVRTGVFRLIQEEWLHATPIGRRSAYALTDSGRRRINHAYRRIYDAPRKTWNGEWQIVIVPEGALPAGEREALRRDLLWDGCGAIAPGVFAHPSSDTEQLRDALRQSGSEDKVVLLQASTLDGMTSTPLQTLVHNCWHLDRLADDYRRFVDRFEAARDWWREGSEPTPEQCFVLRTLLIHEFRRVQLRDPQLPEVLLSRSWPGHAARQLCREVYAMTLEGSQHYLEGTLETPTGSLPPAEKALYQRFDGLAATGDKRREQEKAGAPGRNRTNT